MSTSTTQQPAGWHPDPAGTGGHRYHDGIGWTAQVRHGRVVSKPLGPGFARLGDWLSRVLVLTALLSCLLVAYLVWGHRLVADVVHRPDVQLLGDRPQVPASVQDDLGRFALVGVVLCLAYVVVGGLTAVLWIVWQHRLVVSAPKAVRRSPFMHVLSWVLPVVSYWWPLQNVGDLWRAYGADREPTSQSHPVLIPLWWATFVGQPVVASVGVLVLFSSGSSTTTDLLPGLLLVYTAQAVLVVAGAVAARHIVQGLSWRALVHFAASDA